MNDSGLNSVHKDFTYHFTKCAIISNITMYFARVTVLKKIDTKQNYVVQQCDDYVQSANTLFHFMQRYWHRYASGVRAVWRACRRDRLHRELLRLRCADAPGYDRRMHDQGRQITN